MTYYGIVSKIKEEHKSGIYGHKKLDDKDLENLKVELSEFDWMDTALIVASIIVPYSRGFGIGTFLGKKAYSYFNNKPLKYLGEVKSKNKTLVVLNSALDNNYNLEDGFSYGLLDQFTFKNYAFKKLMKSKGGSELLILQRDDMPEKLNHIVSLSNIEGFDGNFSEGIYTVHPYDENILIPIVNLHKQIETLTLEETIRTYEALGAKEITIIDLTNVNYKAKSKYKNTEGNINVNFGEKVLRREKFAKGVFDKERALKNKLFISDIPSVMSTIEARINGNQIEKEFESEINLSMGLDLSVLKMFSLNSKFNYNRKWYFKVEFYNKDEILS